jgi:CheY-like chemotaxis protein
MRDQTLRIGVSLGALAIAVMHLWKPNLQIDSVTVVLLVIAVLPWVQPLIKSIELLGVKLELRELQNRVAEAQEAAEGASQQATLALAATGAIGQIGGKRVLWVDDEPQNNEHGIKALQAQGIEVVTCKTTQEALEKVQSGQFNVIITDQLRYEDGIRKDRAGYELIGQLQKAGIKVPVILSTASPNREEAHNLGFYDTATTQQGVFELVMKAIKGTGTALNVSSQADR